MRILLWSSNVSDVWVNGRQLVANKQLVAQSVTTLQENLAQQMTEFVEEAKKRSEEVV